MRLVLLFGCVSGSKFKLCRKHRDAIVTKKKQNPKQTNTRCSKNSRGFRQYCFEVAATNSKLLFGATFIIKYILCPELKISLQRLNVVKMCFCCLIVLVEGILFLEGVTAKATNFFFAAVGGTQEKDRIIYLLPELPLLKLS